MKVLALTLKAFGHFTDRTLDLSAGSEGLHIIYGPNEAGKSTALRGLKALFFGIAERTSDNFLHDNQKMRVAGTLRNSQGDILEFQRRKGRLRTLLDRSGAVLDDALLYAFLGSMEEALFTRMFAITHADLVRAGKEMTAGSGDLGESLFSAGTGIAGIRRVIEDLQEEAHRLFKPRASTPLINSLLSVYNEARQECTKRVLSVREWEEQERLLRNAHTEREVLAEKRLRFQTEQGRLVRIKGALPVIAERKELLRQRREMGEVLLLDPSFAQEWSGALNRRTQAGAEEQHALEGLKALEVSLGKLVIHEELLSQDQVIQNLHQRLGSHLKAVEDRRRLRTERDQLGARIEALCKDLEVIPEQIEALRLSLPQKQEIRKRATRIVSLGQSREEALRRVRSLGAKISARTDELNARGVSADIGELRAVLRNMQGEVSLETHLGEARSELALAQAEAEVGLKRLPNWSGTLEDLDALSLPAPETIARFESDMNSTEQELARLGTRILELDRRTRELDTNIQALHLVGEVPTEADLFSAREYRQRGWALLKRFGLTQADSSEEREEYTKGAPLEEVYEESVLAADEIADRLRRESERVAQKATWLAEKELCLEERETLERSREEVSRTGDSLLREWEELWVSQGVKPLPPKEMRSWILQQQKLLGTALNIRSSRERAGRIAQRIHELKQILTRALQQFCAVEEISGLSLQELFARGQTIVDTVVEMNNARATVLKGLEELTPQLRDAELEVQELAEGLTASTREWQEAVQGLPFAASKDPAAAALLIDKADEIITTADKRATLESRIQGITVDERVFSEDVRILAERIAPDLASLPVEQAVSELTARLMQAKKDDAVRAQLLEQHREELTRLQEAQQTKSETKRRLEALRSTAKCRTEDDMDLLLQRSDTARKLDDGIMQQEQQLRTYTAGATIDEFVAEAALIEPDGLESRIQSLSEEIKTAEERLSGLDQTIGAVKRELAAMNGSAQAADAADAAQASLAQIKGAAERYIHLVTARAVLKAEVERYREANKGPVLGRASQYFSVMTQGAFVELKADFDTDDRPILLGVRANGDEVTVEGMSDGTCDQLYLALRLASLEHHLKASEPLPFIVDDILVNFDDGRAQATLKALAELSTKTQILFFTHHRHLLNLVQDTVPKSHCFIHTL